MLGYDLCHASPSCPPADYSSTQQGVIFPMSFTRALTWVLACVIAPSSTVKRSRCAHTSKGCLIREELIISSYALGGSKPRLDGPETF